AAEVDADRGALPEYRMLAAVARIHRALAVARAGEDGAPRLFAEDIGVGQAELAHGAFDQRGEALRHRAEELAARLDQVLGRVGIAQRPLLGERRLASGKANEEGEADKDAMQHSALPVRQFGGLA